MPGEIWYVVKDLSITKPILKQWRTVKAKARQRLQQTILFTEFDDLICNKPDAKVIDESGSSKSIWELFKTSQGQSGFEDLALSSPAVSDPKSNQQDNSAPEFPKSVPSGLDSSLSTCVLEEGVEAYRHREKFGSGVNEKGENKLK